jgi:hypothetical protein
MEGPFNTEDRAIFVVIDMAVRLDIQGGAVFCLKDKLKVNDRCS